MLSCLRVLLDQELRNYLANVLPHPSVTLAGITSGLLQSFSGTPGTAAEGFNAHTTNQSELVQQRNLLAKTIDPQRSN